MSFICDICNKPQTAGTKPNRKTTEVRTKATGGLEIAKEVDACDKCAPKIGEPKNVTTAISTLLG